ncbi:hypothetical protein DERF_007694, partial [Dermatophagoides farinae]
MKMMATINVTNQAIHIQFQINAAYSSKESRRFFRNGGHRILFDCIQYYATLIYL